MALTDHDHTFDTKGDLLLVFPRRDPTTPPPDRANSPAQGAKLALTPSTELVPYPGPTPIRMLVSSKHLFLASPVFENLLRSHSLLSPETSNSGTPSSAASHSSSNSNASTNPFFVPRELELPDDDPEAFAILLGILHNKLKQTPKVVNLAQLGAIAILVDKYALHEAVGFVSDTWIRGLRGEIPRSITAEFRPWLFISWVFGLEREFTELTQIAQRKSTRNLGEWKSKFAIPLRIFDKIDATRQTALTTSLASVTHQITRYSSSKTLCTTSWSNSRSHTTLSSTPLLPNPGNFACDARVLGTLMKSASMAGLLALKAPYTGVSFSGIAKKVRALSVEAMCDIVVLSPEQPLPAHGVKAAIEFSVEKSERMLCGLQLKEFKGVDEEVRLPLSHVFKFSAA